MEHSAILSTFIKLPFVIKIFVLSIFEWPLKTGLTVLAHAYCVEKSSLQYDPLSHYVTQAVEGGAQWLSW